MKKLEAKLETVHANLKEIKNTNKLKDLGILSPGNLENSDQVK